MNASDNAVIGRVPTKRPMTLTRVLDAPRELVWEVYTQPEHMVHWLASRDWTTPSARNELRKGGTFKIEMRELNGREGFFFEGTYDEVRKPELLVQLIGDGRIMRTTFEDLGGTKTKLTLSWEMALDETLEIGGYTQILDKLTEYVADRRPNKPEIIVTRVIDAPRDLVFRAFTDAAHLREWFGPSGFAIKEARSDARPDGAFAICMHIPGGPGPEYWVRGVYREVDAPERVVMTMSGEGSEGTAADTQLTLSFVEREGRTLVILHQTGMSEHAGGATEGWKQALDKLAAYLSKR